MQNTDDKVDLIIYYGKKNTLVVNYDIPILTIPRNIILYWLCLSGKYKNSAYYMGIKLCNIPPSSLVNVDNKKNEKNPFLKLVILIYRIK